MAIRPDVAGLPQTASSEPRVRHLEHVAPRDPAEAAQATGRSSVHRFLEMVEKQLGDEVETVA